MGKCRLWVNVSWVYVAMGICRMGICRLTFLTDLHCQGETHEEPDLEGGEQVGGLSSVSRGGYKLPLKILGITSSLILQASTHYKSHIAKLQLENEILKRKEARNDVMVSIPHNQS